MKVFILKEGKEAGQGVGYLDDGTMVVVDQGKKALGKTIEVSVTSVLQTTAGKMIFCRWPEAGVFDDTLRGQLRSGERSERFRDARAAIGPSRREGERSDRHVAPPPPLVEAPRVAEAALPVEPAGDKPAPKPDTA